MKSGNETVDLLIADLSSQQSIRRLADTFQQLYPNLHVLINNAGAGFSQRQESVDGVEMTFAVNYLAPFLLTNLHLDVLKKSAPARIINVDSNNHRFVRLDMQDLQLKQRFESYRGIYAMVGLVGSPLFRFLSYHFNFFLEYTLKNITKRPKQHFSEREKQAYRGPNLDRAVRRYPHDLFKSVTKSHDYLADLEQRLSAIKEKQIPALHIFGDQDATIKMGWLARLERIFPRHRTIIMKGSHHFPQIYDSAAVADAIRGFWDEVITVS